MGQGAATASMLAVRPCFLLSGASPSFSAFRLTRWLICSRADTPCLEALGALSTTKTRRLLGGNACAEAPGASTATPHGSSRAPLRTHSCAALGGISVATGASCVPMRLGRSSNPPEMLCVLCGNEQRILWCPTVPVGRYDLCSSASDSGFRDCFRQPCASWAISKPNIIKQKEGWHPCLSALALLSALLAWQHPESTMSS